MDTRWKPNVTVAAVIQRDGKFLLVEEHTSRGLMLNNPAGHLEPGESIVEGCIREVLEETARHFVPTGLLGVYLTSQPKPGLTTSGALPRDKAEDITYLRFALRGDVGDIQLERQLDTGIVRTLWLSADEIQASQDRHRSPLVMQCMRDHLAGRNHPLDLLQAHWPAER